MTKEEFIAKWQNELIGLLMESFLNAHEGNEGVSSQRFNMQSIGRATIEQMKRAKNLLGRMHDSTVDSPLMGKPKGTP